MNKINDITILINDKTFQKFDELIVKLKELKLDIDYELIII